MTTAIILSAGQGKRLLPHTEHCPKCLLSLGDKTILEWQIDTLLAAGLSEINIVTGFHATLIDELIARLYPGAQVKTLLNPFFDVSDNLASCWLARQAMQDDFILLNGDTLFERAILDKVLHSPTCPITLTIDYKDDYDDDDMKVELAGAQVVHVSKALTAGQTHAESIGLLYFRNNGAALFRQALEENMRQPKRLKAWFLSVIDALAGLGLVTSCSIKGLHWAEIDFIDDLQRAKSIFAGEESLGETQP